jgi:hypothetical protein
MYVFQKRFVDWFDRLLPAQQAALARLYWFLCTDDLSDLAQADEHLVRKFRAYAAAANPPVRALARLRGIVSIVDFILENVDALLHIRHAALEPGGKVVRLDRRHWERTVYAWKKRKAAEWSDEHFSGWLQHILSSL